MTNTYTHDNAQATGIALAHTIHGDPVAHSLVQASANEGTVRQVQSTFRNYEPPVRKDEDGRVVCAHEGCMGIPAKDGHYCPGHARMHGEAPCCQHRDCSGAPMKGTKFCRWHTPKVAEGEPD